MVLWHCLALSSAGQLTPGLLMIKASPVDYVRGMQLCGSLFENLVGVIAEPGAISTVYTTFFVNHKEPFLWFYGTVWRCPVLVSWPQVYWCSIIIWISAKNTDLGSSEGMLLEFEMEAIEERTFPLKVILSKLTIMWLYTWQRQVQAWQQQRQRPENIWVLEIPTSPVDRTGICIGTDIAIFDLLFLHFAPFDRNYSRCLQRDWSRNRSLQLPLIKTK